MIDLRARMVRGDRLVAFDESYFVQTSCGWLDHLILNLLASLLYQSDLEASSKTTQSPV